jgi:hypothetical protein
MAQTSQMAKPRGPGPTHYSCIHRLWVRSRGSNFWMAQPKICSLIVLLYVLYRLWVGSPGSNLRMVQPRNYSLLLHSQALSRVFWFKLLDGSAKDLFTYYALVFPGSESGVLVQTFGWFSPGSTHYSCIPRLWVGGSFGSNFWMAQPRIFLLIMLLYFQALSRVSWLKPLDGSAQGLLTTLVFTGSESGLLVQILGWLSPGPAQWLCSCILQAPSRVSWFKTLGLL